ncbi:MAG: alpha/beta hydrolase, partial [Pseudomonadota bacterium]|nr:alpha/beta hydrolase [Pseudomonadota bacterium]
TIPLFHVTGQGFNRTPSDNIQMLKNLRRDKLVIKYTRIDTLYGLVDLMDAALDAVPKTRGRTLILLGSQEDIMPEGATQALLTALPKAACVRVARYQAGFHMLLRDLQAATVLTDIAAWIGDPVTALPSGADRAMNASEQEAAKEPESKQVSGATAPLVLSCQPPTAARP